MPSVSGMEELLGVHVPPPRELFEIREVHVSSALRRDPLPGIDYSFNPYIGCYHGCTFCYVPRLRCLRALADAGLTTFVGFAPAYPPTDGWSPNEIAEVFAEAGVKKMFTRALDPRWGVPEAIAKRLEGSDLAPDLLRLGDLDTIAPFVSRLAEACRARGIDFRNAFEFRMADSNQSFGSPAKALGSR